MDITYIERLSKEKRDVLTKLVKKPKPNFDKK